MRVVVDIIFVQKLTEVKTIDYKHICIKMIIYINSPLSLHREVYF